MTKEELKILWLDRHAKVDRFIANPEDFKECEQCRSILVRSAGICWCGAYRFLEDLERIRATAREMAMRPYPLGAGVVPRIKLIRAGAESTPSAAGKQVEFDAVRKRKKRS